MPGFVPLEDTLLGQAGHHHGARHQGNFIPASSHQMEVWNPSDSSPPRRCTTRLIRSDCPDVRYGVWGKIVIFTIGDICHESQPRDAGTQERKVLSVAEIPSRSTTAPQSTDRRGMV